MTAQCDHIIGSVGAIYCTAETWPQYASEFEAAVEFFNTTRLAVPHPGFCERHAFCFKCGARIDPAVFNQPIPKFNGVPKIYARYSKFKERVSTKPNRPRIKRN